MAATRARVYFTIKHPLHPNNAIIQQIHRLLLSGFTIDNAAGLEGLRTARDSQNLHLRLILDDPLDPLSWAELKPLADAIDAYFEKLRKHRPDALSLALYQAPTKKQEAETISARIENALLVDSLVTIEEVRLLESDLNLLFNDIRAAVL